MELSGIHGLMPNSVANVKIIVSCKISLNWTREIGCHTTVGPRNGLWPESVSPPFLLGGGRKWEKSFVTSALRVRIRISKRPRFATRRRWNKSGRTTFFPKKVEILVGEPLFGPPLSLPIRQFAVTFESALFTKDICNGNASLIYVLCTLLLRLGLSPHKAQADSWCRVEVSTRLF